MLYLITIVVSHVQIGCFPVQEWLWRQNMYFNNYVQTVKIESSVLPDNATAIIDTKAWTRPPVFDWLQQGGNIDEHEMHRTLNCGVGMVICVPANTAASAVEFLNANGEEAFILGTIEETKSGEEQVQLLGLSE